MSDEMIQIDPEFIVENKLVQTGPKSGGPYSKKERQARREEVFRLHIELGYSARKISNLMKVNRKTINEDIRACYSHLAKENRNTFYEKVVGQFHRFELQRARLIEELEKTNNLPDKLAIERMISEIDSKELNFLIKIEFTEEKQHQVELEALNNFAEKRKLDLRYIRPQDIIKVSKKCAEQIWKVIEKDPKREITYR